MIRIHCKKNISEINSEDFLEKVFSPQAQMFTLRLKKLKNKKSQSRNLLWLHDEDLNFSWFAEIQNQRLLRSNHILQIPEKLAVW